MATLQLTFTLRTSPNCKTVHLVGNWDGYKGQLPLSKDSSKAGAWKGTFRFQNSTLKQGQRYWYYYMIDGYHVSHDPAQQSTTEPTTGRKLNILDVPSAKPALAVDTKSSSSSRSSRRVSSADVAQGRGVSPSKIVSPRPTRPKETQSITKARYSTASPEDIDRLTGRLARTKVSSSSFSDESEESDSDIDSEVSSDVPSLSSSGSSRGSPSSLRSPASPTGSACSCECWGRNRHGDRVKLDCGGSRCGSSCSESDSEDEYYRTKLVNSRGDARRQGVVVRDSRDSRDSRRYRR